jgi:uncharacterized protein YkwD
MRILRFVLPALLIIGVVSAFLFIYWHPISFPNTANPDQASPSSTSVPNSLQIELNHEELVDYALSLINADRQTFSNLQNVSLSSTVSAQQHAEDMLRNNYFSHWDAQGYKPYVRYTLAGGKGAVNENIAAQFWHSSDSKAAIADLEWRMVNDDAESNWGHKANILDAFHNKVSIGIAYDENSLYLVQDFENDYVDWTTLTTSQGDVTMVGHFTSPGLAIKQVGVYFDQVAILTSQQLENAPYNGSYDSGHFVGVVLPPGWQSGQDVALTANVWRQVVLDFQINFNLFPLFELNGKGIYTVYLYTENDECLVTNSVFYSG